MGLRGRANPFAHIAPVPHTTHSFMGPQQQAQVHRSLPAMPPRTPRPHRGLTRPRPMGTVKPSWSYPRSHLRAPTVPSHHASAFHGVHGPAQCPFGLTWCAARSVCASPASCQVAFQVHPDVYNEVPIAGESTTVVAEPIVVEPVVVEPMTPKPAPTSSSVCGQALSCTECHERGADEVKCMWSTWVGEERLIMPGQEAHSHDSYEENEISSSPEPEPTPMMTMDYEKQEKSGYCMEREEAFKSTMTEGIMNMRTFEPSVPVCHWLSGKHWNDPHGWHGHGEDSSSDDLLIGPSELGPTAEPADYDCEEVCLLKPTRCGVRKSRCCGGRPTKNTYAWGGEDHCCVGTIECDMQSE